MSNLKKLLTILSILSASLVVNAQQKDCEVLLNHFLIGVDSSTYQAILKSELVNSDFAFAREMNKNWQGIYLFGQDNYIEVFHPNSVPNDYVPVGFTWVCLSSLYPNCIQKYMLAKNERTTYSSDESFDDLSLDTHDSTTLITTKEINKAFYEGWAKKTYYDTVKYETTDYNSKADSDSSKNYLFKNVTGLEIEANTKDSLSICQYFDMIGYIISTKTNNTIKFQGSKDFMELRFSDQAKQATIKTIHFELNKSVPLKTITTGTCEVTLEGEKGVWVLDRTKN